MPTLLVPRTAVTVEKLDAGPAPGRAELQSTRDDILAGILRTPTVWMDFDSVVDGELDITTPYPHRVGEVSGAIPLVPPVVSETRVAQRPGVRQAGIHTEITHRITRRSARRN